MKLSEAKQIRSMEFGWDILDCITREEGGIAGSTVKPDDCRMDFSNTPICNLPDWA